MFGVCYAHTQPTNCRASLLRQHRFIMCRLVANNTSRRQSENIISCSDQSYKCNATDRRNLLNQYRVPSMAVDNYYKLVVWRQKFNQNRGSFFFLATRSKFSANNDNTIIQHRNEVSLHFPPSTKTVFLSVIGGWSNGITRIHNLSLHRSR